MTQQESVGIPVKPREGDGGAYPQTCDVEHQRFLADTYNVFPA